MTDPETPNVSIVYPIQLSPASSIPLNTSAFFNLSPDSPIFNLGALNSQSNDIRSREFSCQECSRLCSELFEMKEKWVNSQEIIATLYKSKQDMIIEMEQLKLSALFVKPEENFSSNPSTVTFDKKQQINQLITRIANSEINMDTLKIECQQKHSLVARLEFQLSEARSNEALYLQEKLECQQMIDSLTINNEKLFNKYMEYEKLYNELLLKNELVNNKYDVQKELVDLLSLREEKFEKETNELQQQILGLKEQSVHRNDGREVAFGTEVDQVLKTPKPSINTSQRDAARAKIEELKLKTDTEKLFLESKDGHLERKKRLNVLQQDRLMSPNQSQLLATILPDRSEAIESQHLRHELNDAVETLRKEEWKNADLQAQICSLQGLLNAEKSDSFAMTNEIEKLKSHLLSVLDKFEQSVNECKSLKLKLQTVDDINNIQKNDEKLKMESNNQALQLLINDLEIERNEKENLLNLRNTHVEMISSLTVDIEELKVLNQNLSLEKSSNGNDYNNLLSSTLKELENEHQTNKTFISAMNDISNSMASVIEENYVITEYLFNNLSQSEILNKQLHGQLRDAQGLIDDSLITLCDRNNKIKELNNLVLDNNEKYSNENSQKNKLQETLFNLQEEYNKLKCNTDNESLLVQLKQENIQYQTEIQNLKICLDGAVRDIETLEADLENAENNYQMMDAMNRSAIKPEITNESKDVQTELTICTHSETMTTNENVQESLPLVEISTMTMTMSCDSCDTLIEEIKSLKNEYNVLKLSIDQNHHCTQKYVLQIHEMEKLVESLENNYKYINNRYEAVVSIINECTNGFAQLKLDYDSITTKLLHSQQSVNHYYDWITSNNEYIASIKSDIEDVYTSFQSLENRYQQLKTIRHSSVLLELDHIKYNHNNHQQQANEMFCILYNLQQNISKLTQEIHLLSESMKYLITQEKYLNEELMNVNIELTQTHESMTEMSSHHAQACLTYENEILEIGKVLADYKANFNETKHQMNIEKQIIVDYEHRQNELSQNNSSLQKYLKELEIKISIIELNSNKFQKENRVLIEQLTIALQENEKLQSMITDHINNDNLAVSNKNKENLSSSELRAVELFMNIEDAIHVAERRQYEQHCIVLSNRIRNQNLTLSNVSHCINNNEMTIEEVIHLRKNNIIKRRMCDRQKRSKSGMYSYDLSGKILHFNK